MRADIFFFVTTIAVVIITVGLIAVIIYTLKLLHRLNGIVDDSRKQLANLTAFVDNQLSLPGSKVGSLIAVGEALVKLYGSLRPKKSSKSRNTATKRSRS